MHVGFVIRKITDKEIAHKCVYIPLKDREIFPSSNVLFFVDSYEDTYGAYISEDGFLFGIDKWFEEYPHRENDTVILSKTADGYSLSSTSELVQQQVNEEFEKTRIEKTDIKAELCPNCQFALECVGKKKDRFVIKCARCGFTMVRRKPCLN